MTHNCNGIRALQVLDSHLDGVQDIPIVLRINQMRNDLCVRLTIKRITKIDEIFSDLLIVFNDTVVDYRDTRLTPTGSARNMRMCVHH
ncbi:hypothetical protein PBCV1_a101L [Paramecium bursaria Chlorella virus 1]|uniref:Uncharacterized protein n=1 Tax=Paramecium bursaria Chlorella virus 1 TaxID=10506 RepID=Q84422_PBCV1|nr:hypothetical protein PBCV1_a101L [Paramecium bursaria Chlorella virus 1]AAC96469.1 hypothetical protein [Paramecium bursaria Chlorella virus 1]